MSWLDSALGAVQKAGDYVAYAVTAPVWYAATDAPHPLEVEWAKQEERKAIARASGVGVGGKTVVASAAEVKRRQVQAEKEIDAALRSTGQHPDDVTKPLLDLINDPGKLRSTVILVAAVGIGVYMLTEIAKSFVSRRS